MTRIRLVALAVVAVLAAAPAGAAELLAAFTVLGPSGAVARAIVDGPVCPSIEVDGKTAVMTVRAAPDGRFPLVCDTLLPAAAAHARIGDRDLPLPKPATGRIALFGDSGCRVDARAGEVQACNDAGGWPFARTSGAAAALAPDLVIHVGDYLYRESPCPPSYAGCAGTPSGDDWPAWDADFFAPAAKLLAAAPWVMVRGNHENCNRSGTGFFRLLDPRPRPPQCVPISDTYRVTAGDLTFFVLDSGEAADVQPSAQLVERYRPKFAQLGTPPAGSWLLTHRPLWASVRISNAMGMSLVVNDNETLQAASGNTLPPGIALVLSGHIHLFEALSFADHRPPQLVLGTAGSSLSDAIGTDLTGWQIAGTTVAYARTAHVFGVTTMERKGAGWTMTLRDEAGAPLIACTIAGPHLSCMP
jgi:hypothetical protein